MKQQWVHTLYIIMVFLLIPVGFAQGQTPSNTPTIMALATTSTPDSINTKNIPSPTPIPSFFERTEIAWIGLAGLIFGSLITGTFGLWQYKKSSKTQKELELEKHNREHELEQQRQKWELEKIQLQHQLDLERTRSNTEQEKLAHKEELEEAARQLAEFKDEKNKTVEEHAISYRQKLINELSNLKILDMPSPLRLESVYVQVRVRPEEYKHYTDESEIKPLAEGEPLELLRHSQMYLVERARDAMSPKEALAKLRRMTVLGDPGAGKTTQLRYLALQMARGEFNDLPTLPIYIELRRFVDSGLGNLLDFAASDLAERYGFAEGRSYLEQHLELGKASLLLDGLDEVLGGASVQEAQLAYNRVAAEINRLATRYPEVLIAVTCRRAGWRGGLTAFQTLEVLDFDWEQIQNFVGNWFETNFSKAEGLRQALAVNLRMQTLAANPLILSLIAIVYEQELELPERRAELYNRCVEVLLREWDSKRGIRRFCQFTTDRKRDLLEEVAWHFHSAGRRYFPEAELLQLISQFLPTVNIPQEENKAILDEIAAQYGLLKMQAHGWYGFLHLTIQEYFTAIAANERGMKGVEDVISRSDDPWWEEVILLLAGRMNDASPLLLGLYGRPDGGSISGNIEELSTNGISLVINDDFFHNRLLLAGNCLVGTPRVRINGVRELIIAEIKRILLSSPYRFDWQRSAQVLVAIGGKELVAELLDIVRSASIQPTERREAILEAFGDLGDRSVAPFLLQFLESAENLDDFVTVNLVNALVSLKTFSAVPYFHTMLKASKEKPLVQSRLARALGRLGSKSVLADLRDILLLSKNKEEWLWGYACGEIAEAMALLGDKSIIPDLIAILKTNKNLAGFPQQKICIALIKLCDNSNINELLQLLTCGEISVTLATDIVRVILILMNYSFSSSLSEILLNDSVKPLVKVAIANALSKFQDISPENDIVEHLRDEAVPWQTRWLLTECLESFKINKPTRIMELLDSPEIDERVRIGIAATLGKWGIRESIPYLHRAIIERIIPISWYMNGFTHIGRFWYRICRVLNSLGDNSTLPILENVFNEMISNNHSSITLKSTNDIGGIIKTASIFKSEVIGRQIITILINQDREKIILPEDELLRRLSHLVTKPLVPSLLDLLAKSLYRSRPLFSEWESIIDEIVRVSDDINTIEDFLQILPRNPTEEEKYLSDTMYQALHKLSKRIKILVTSQGHVQLL